MSHTAALSTPAEVRPGRGIQIGLWVAQILLALAFGMAGAMKATTPYDQLAAAMSWVPYAPEALVRFIGISEIAGALGLVLPALTRIQPRLTPLAAALLAIVMVLAAATHAWFAEWSGIGVNAVLGGLAAFVAWGRTVRAPIASRG